jgi:hypothetical protein
MCLRSSNGGCLARKARTPALPKAIAISPLPAQLRHPRPRSETGASRRLRPLFEGEVADGRSDWFLFRSLSAISCSDV